VDCHERQEQVVAHSSVLTRTTQQIGGSFGTAVLAVILSRSVTAHPGDIAAAFNVAALALAAGPSGSSGC
jgi:hypothetical protein